MKLLFLALSAAACAFAADPFVVKPYLQLGDAPKLGKTAELTILWHTADAPAEWSVSVKRGKAGKPIAQRIAVPGIDPHLVYSARLSGLEPGAPFEYSLRKQGTVVFSATGRARKSARQPYRMVVFGDIAQGTPQQRQIAYQVWQSKPDAVFVAGDIVYSRGRIGEYRDRYFPVYNADEASPAAGAPLLRSTLFIAAPGNHDTGGRDLTKMPDALAYFLYWRQPLNGPDHSSFNFLEGAPADQAAFRAAAGVQFPRLANYSYDYGNAHWLVLDSNPYVDWTDPALRAWAAADLAAANNATWKFVAFHHPGFSSSKAHFNEQHMRVLAGVFEQAGVDVVFAGHVHNYQRSYPLKFQIGAYNLKTSRVVPGEFQIDKDFDGASNTRPQGVIYLVTGGGGAGLYDVGQGGAPATWQPFTTKFVSQVHSFTVLDVAGRKATFQQISADGVVVDSWVVTK